MVDINTHRIIDLLPSREIKDVTEWLKSFPNLEIVSRDGSMSYNSSIKQADRSIVQVSVLWSSIFVTFVAKKIHWIVAWILPESPVYVKDASHRLGAALSLTYTKPSW